MKCYGAIIRRRSTLDNVDISRAEAMLAIAMRSCRVGQGDYLIVSPEITWLTADNDFSADLEVVSNVKWTVD